MISNDVIAHYFHKSSHPLISPTAFSAGSGSVLFYIPIGVSCGERSSRPPDSLQTKMENSFNV